MAIVTPNRNASGLIGGVSASWPKAIVVCLSLILLTVATIVSQDKATISRHLKGFAGPGGRLDKSKPSVFLSFEGEEVVDENCSLKKEPSYLLRLRNNTSSAINVDANYSTDLRTATLILPDGAKGVGLSDGTRVTLCYQVEPILTITSGSKKGGLRKEIPTERDVPELAAYCRCAWSQQRSRRDDDYLGIWIQSGSSVVFAVPKQYLADGLKVFTIFNYDWEFENGKLRSNEPHHQVFFYSTDLRPRTSSQIAPSKSISPND